MWINTSRFGRIDVDAADILRFPSGLPGLEDCREWALLADASNDALGWLQCTTRGDKALAVVSRRGTPPATSMSQRLVVLLFFSMDHSCTVNTAILPSGESAGLPRRFMAQRSCGAMGRLSAAKIVPVSASV
ncbi:MAG: flagellar assembly protein FliW, partial [Planctomycetota bacterium]